MFASAYLHKPIVVVVAVVVVAVVVIAVENQDSPVARVLSPYFSPWG